MLTIDSQVHAYERNHPGRPWQGVLRGPPSVTGNEMVAAMDMVGVDGAILVSPFSMYRYDASYALECHKAHPGKFGLVKPVDASDPAVGETIADWKATPGTVGIRLMLNREGVRGMFRPREIMKKCPYPRRMLARISVASSSSSRQTMMSLSV